VRNHSPLRRKGVFPKRYAEQCWRSRHATFVICPISALSAGLTSASDDFSSSAILAACARMMRSKLIGWFISLDEHPSLWNFDCIKQECMTEKASLRLATLIVLLCCRGGIAAQDRGGTSSSSTPGLHVTHILGFEGVANNATGELIIAGDFLRFEKSGSPGTQIAIPCIKDLYVGTEDRQVGGTPLAVTRAAVPYGGGRVVGMFSHKKYDFVTIEYVDSNNGLHGAIFQLDKGESQTFRNALTAAGAEVSDGADQSAHSQTPGTNK